MEENRDEILLAAPTTPNQTLPLEMKIYHQIFSSRIFCELEEVKNVGKLKEPVESDHKMTNPEKPHILLD